MNQIDSVQEAQAVPLNQETVSPTVKDWAGGSIALPELMPDSFVKQHSRFDNIQQFIKTSGIRQLAEIGGAAWNQFVADNTDFADWETMVITAAAEWGSRNHHT